MLFLGILIFILITLIPGLLAVRLLRVRNPHTFDSLLYAVGLGVVFVLVAGLVANFTFGINLASVVIVFIGLFVILFVCSRKFGKRLTIDWKHGWKSTVVLLPIGIYLLAVALQLQTTLMSPNLVGSDIHLEYYYANLILEQGFWNPSWSGSTINACLGIIVLIPEYVLLTGMKLMWVFKLICPLIFAVLPVVLYRIYKMQFGTVVAALSVVFFITMPMFTMDMLQLIRQQQSELFFVLVVLLLLDENMSLSRKIILGGIFGLGAIATHYGFSVGYVGYMLICSIVAVILARLWKRKHELEDARKPMLTRLALVYMAVIAVVSYIGYYNSVSNGRLIKFGAIPVAVVGNTVDQVSSGITDLVTDTPPSPKPSTPNSPVLEPFGDTDTFLGHFISSITKRFPFLNPLLRESLLQTAIGLDFTKASALGKIWRVLQYLVELFLVVGLFKLLFRPNSKIRLDYVAFVITSFFVLGGMYTLATTSWGMGATRIWHATLLFMSPLFVIGAGTIGGWVVKLKKNAKFNEGKVIVLSTLVLFIPYFVFNSGVVFELSKSLPVRFIDIPYSIALSGHRVDIASVFDEEDVEAMDWLKDYIIQHGVVGRAYSDVHGCNLIVQRIGYDLRNFQSLRVIRADSVGYIFLRKWNVENNMVTFVGEYGCRQSYSIDELEIVKQKIESGMVMFDNGARIICVK